MHPCSLSRSWSGRWRRYDATRTAHRVFLAVGSTDTRKSINGLSIMVEQVMDQNPFTGDLFVFCNRKRNMIKILYWNYNGFCIWLKRLEEHRFTWPRTREEVISIGPKELELQKPEAFSDKASRVKLYLYTAIP